jgi:hypothetical protein
VCLGVLLEQVTANIDIFAFTDLAGAKDDLDQEGEGNLRVLVVGDHSKAREVMLLCLCLLVAWVRCLMVKPVRAMDKACAHVNGRACRSGSL